MQCGSHTKVMKSTEFMFTSFNDKSNDILNSLFSAQFGVCNSGFRFFFYCAHRYHATTHIESICRQSNHRYCWLRIIPSRITCDCCETFSKSNSYLNASRQVMSVWLETCMRWPLMDYLVTSSAHSGFTFCCCLSNRFSGLVELYCCLGCM